MVHVEFENQIVTPRESFIAQRKGLTAWVIKKGIVKDETGAIYLFIAIIIICIGIIYFLLASNGDNSIKKIEEDLHQKKQFLPS